MKPMWSVVFIGIVLLPLASPWAEGNEQRNSSAIVSHISREPVQSRGLAAVGYSKRLHALEIEFINGAIYRYLEVPPSIYRGLVAADSKARFYDENIRGRYRSLHVRRRAR